MTSDNAHPRGPQATGTTSDNTKPSAAPLAGRQPVGIPTAQGVAFHYCATPDEAPACGRVPDTALRRHVALPAADVPADLRCRYRGCHTAYDALDQTGDGAGR